MSEPIELILNPNKQLLRLNCGQCGDTKDIAIEIRNDLSTIHRRKIEVAVESILVDFASKVGTEDARSSRVTADEIVEKILDVLDKNNRINVVIQDASDLTNDEDPEFLLSPVELIV